MGRMADTGRRAPPVTGAAFVVGAALAVLGVSGAPLQTRLNAQPPRLVNKLATGRFLVASRDLPDPNFSETVVVLTQYDEKGTMGFVINRQTKVELSRLFRDFKDAKDRKDAVYVGGPVGMSGALGLVRTSTKPSDTKPSEARHLFSDIYLLSSKEALEKALTVTKDASALRVFLGYAGWGVGQLEGEIELGMWHIFDGGPNLIFDNDPASLWTRLIAQTELRIALAAVATKTSI